MAADILAHQLLLLNLSLRLRPSRQHVEHLRPLTTLAAIELLRVALPSLLTRQPRRHPRRLADEDRL